MVAKNLKKMRYYPFCRFPEKHRSIGGESLNYADRVNVWDILSGSIGNTA
jgi:hypothetical protein